MPGRPRITSSLEIMMRNSPHAAGRRATWDSVLSWAVVIAGGAALTFMAVLSTFNVLVMRKGLNDPIRGAEDLMVLALVTVVAIAIPFGARTGAHIEIELMEPYMSPRFATVSHALTKVIGIGLIAMLSWQLWLAGGRAAEFGEASQQLVISFGPFYRVLAVSMACYVLILAVDLWRLITVGTIPAIPLTSDASE